MMKREREKGERAVNDAATPTLTPQACNSHHSLPSIFHGDKQDWKQERLASPLLPVFLDSFSRPCRRFLLVCSTMHSHFRKKPSPVPWANCNLIAVEVWRELGLHLLHVHNILLHYRPSLDITVAFFLCASVTCLIAWLPEFYDDAIGNVYRAIETLHNNWLTWLTLRGRNSNPELHYLGT